MCCGGSDAVVCFVGFYESQVLLVRVDPGCTEPSEPSLDDATVCARACGGMRVELSCG